MKIIEVEQGSPEWLDWRKTVITATDCSAIMGNNPWVTPYKCWQKKLGLIEEQKSNAAMERGVRLEPEARTQFNERRGFPYMLPAVVESTEFEFLGASLDGISVDHKHILEIKCGGIKLHTQAQGGIIPDYYMDQMQHQLLVTRAEKCFYYSFDGKDGVCIEVLPDPGFIERFLPRARIFWKQIAFFEPPTLQQSDYKDMNDSLSWKEYSKMYQETDAAIKALEDKKDYLRRMLIELSADQSCMGNGVKVMKTLMRGRIDYNEIPEIKGLDLDKYRKNASVTWKILVDSAKS